jgi:hypothetical protein
MKQEFNPPRYTWTAATAQEAKNVTQAVEDLIGAHMTTLSPGDGMDRHRAAKAAPVTLTVTLDLSGLVEQINTHRTIADLEASLGDGA